MTPAPLPAPPQVALLVQSCDRYEFLYPGFAFFFNRHWDAATACTRYFATETKRPVLPGFRVVQSGPGAWADRLARLLREQIPEKYVLYFQEDMWLSAPVDHRVLNELFALAERHDWQQVKLHSADVYRTTPTADEVAGFVVATVDNAASGFLMSHQVTLWNKEFLLAQLRPREHPWRNERNATKRLRRLNPLIRQVDYFAENGHPPLNANHNRLPRSEYYTVSVNGTLSDHVRPYIATLRQAGDAGQRQYAGQLARHYEQQLTHDGQPRPRKTDLVKRLKTWLGTLRK